MAAQVATQPRLRVMAAQVARMQTTAASAAATMQGAAAAGGAGAAGASGRAAVSGGEALLQLMRSNWDMPRAVHVALAARGTSSGGGFMGSAPTDNSGFINHNELQVIVS